jgi:uncharacterized protein (DUF433 family)
MRPTEKGKLVLTKGKDALTVEDRSEEEAWHRALKKARRSGGREETQPMRFQIQDVVSPLRTDEYGVVRVGKSQVLLDVVVREFKKGARAEEIVNAYPTLKLAEVYAVIAHYLQHQSEVEEYLQARHDEAVATRNEIEAARPTEPDLRNKLMSRMTPLEQGNASSRE